MDMTVSANLTPNHPSGRQFFYYPAVDITNGTTD